MANTKRTATFAPLERDIQAAVLEHWRLLGWANTLVAAIPNAGAMGQPGLTPGLPDLLVIGPRLPSGCIGFIELKRDRKSPRTDAQRRFAQLSLELGIPYAVCFGRDEPIRILERWNVIRPRVRTTPPWRGPPHEARSVRKVGSPPDGMKRSARTNSEPDDYPPPLTPLQAVSRPSIALQPETPSFAVLPGAAKNARLVAETSPGRRRAARYSQP